MKAITKTIIIFLYYSLHNFTQLRYYHFTLNNTNNLVGIKEVKKIIKQEITTKTIIPIILISFTILFCLTTVSATNDTIYVNGSNGSDDNDGLSWITAKLSIKNATGTVNSNGTVYIADGLYTGEANTNININKNMTIRGQSKTGTVINGTDSARIFIIPAGVSVTLQNLTLTNGRAPDSYAGGSGGAILNAGNLQMNNCLLSNNHAGNGYMFVYKGGYGGDGGAICNTGTLQMNNCTLSDNHAGDGGQGGYGGDGGRGGALYNAGTLQIINCTFINNKDGNGGISWWGYPINGGSGGAILNFGTSTITGSTFINNTAHTVGGAIYNDGSNIELHFNRFLDNNATYGSAIRSDFGTVNAASNWWGSNNPDWSNLLSGVTIPTNWVILTVNVDPDTIYNTQNSTITADFNHINGGGDLIGGHIPDGPITLEIPWGSFTNSGITRSFTADTINGVMTTTFFAIGGVAPLNSVPVNATADNYTTNTTESAYITINPMANFIFNKTIISPIKDKYNVGDMITFAITVKNIGFDTMTNVSIEDELLDFLQFVSASGNYSFNATENTVTWLLPNLGTNDTFTFNLTAKVLDSSGKTVINKANIYNDLYPTHVYDKVEIYEPKSDIYINITSDKTPKVGELFTLTYKLGNKGPDSATNVTITIPLPNGFELTNISGDGIWTYNKATNTITWTLTNVPVGDPYLYITGKVTKAGNYVFGALITSETYNVNTQGVNPITINAVAQANAASSTTKTIGMQNTGLPIPLLVLALLAVFGGLVIPKRK